jgi:RNA polymerase sigma factor (sigma-70 family)
MASASASILRHVEQFMAVHPTERLTDHELVERFVRERDEAAFAAIVRRHGGMVLGLCRRILRHEQDAEDAFQAAFLILARKARTIRRSEAVGGWLYRVAYHLAVRARAAAVKHGRRVGAGLETVPQRGTVPQREPSADHLADVTWREVRAVVDEELGRLPESYRSALVLFYLEGRTQEEAARHLGWSKGTLRRRLDKGRELLRRRLIRRGLAPAAALTASLLADGTTPAVSPVLTRAIIRQAFPSATVSPAVAALAEGCSRSLSVGKAKLALAVILAVGAVTGVGLWTHRSLAAPTGAPLADAAPKAETPAPAPREKKDKQQQLVLQGRVLDPDGKPVKGARLYSPHLLKDPPETDDDVTVVRRGVTDSDGRFRVTIPPSDARLDWGASLVAAADGYGVDWVDLPKGDSTTELTLRLVKEHSIRGRLVSTEGKPLAGARVTIIALMMKPGGRLDDFLTAWEKDWQSAQRRAPKQLEASLHTMASATTDKDGCFRIPGVGSERVAVLQIRGEGIAQKFLYVITRTGFDPRALNKTARERIAAEQRTGDEPPSLYGPRFEHVAAPSRILEGTVREAGSGKPVAGYTISAHAGYNNPVISVSDKQGRYRLVGLPKMKQYLLTAEPPENSSWLRQGARVADTEGLQPLTADFTAARGIVVKGQVIDKTTGRGVQCGLRFTPLPDNPYFAKPGYDSFQYERLTTETDAEGRFRMPVIPGPGVFMAQAWAGAKTEDGQAINPYKQAELDAEAAKHIAVTNTDDGNRYFTAAGNSLEFLDNQNVAKRLDLAPDAGTVTCNLYVERGRTLKVKIQDAEGKPLTGAAVAGLSATGSIVPSLRGDACTVFALDPKKPRRLIFLHSERQLAGTLTVRGDEKEPPTACLVSTGSVIGRLLDGDGQAIAGVEIGLAFDDGDARELYRRVEGERSLVRTDKEGRFRIDGVVPGLKFGLSLRQGRRYLAGEPRIGLRQVKPGETLDLGERRTKPSTP